MGWLDDGAKNLPINDLYRDLVQPAAREVGEALGNAVKVGRFLLAPIDYLAAHHGRWQRYLERVGNKVPDEKERIEAHPQIVGPTLERLRYVDEQGILAEMFVNLLARAMDRQRVAEAHPAFPVLVSQLSPDEAMILFRLKQGELQLHYSIPLNEDRSMFLPGTCILNEFPVDELAFPGNFETYLNHLQSLDLLMFVSKEAQEPIREDGRQVGVIARHIVRVSKFGRLFAQACVPDELKPEWKAEASKDG